VYDQALWFATAPSAELATVLTAPSAARHIERRLLDQVALLRDECEKCKAERAGRDEALAQSRREAQLCMPTRASSVWPRTRREA
jgi:hypothetical protein